MSSLKKCAGWMGLTMLLYGCGGGTSNGQNGANDQPDTLTALDGTADQGCYGCILDVGTDSSPSMGEDKGEGETINGDANVSSGCQSDNQCADEIDCTVDTCLPNGACQSMPDDKLCDDGEVCDIEHDGCFKAKSCFNDEQCDDSVDCTVEGCNTETKLCYPAIKDDARCEDGFVCLPEHPEANFVTGCITGPKCKEDFDCLAQNACAFGVCNLGACQWTLDDALCNDGNPCNGNETCTQIECTAGTPIVCDDGVDCTLDMCEPLQGCIVLPTKECQCESYSVKTESVIDYSPNNPYSNAKLVWTGAELYTAAEQYGNVYVGKIIQTEGTASFDTMSLVAQDGHYPHLIWTGSLLLLSWSDDSATHFGTVSDEGVLKALELTFLTDTNILSMVWADNQAAVARTIWEPADTLTFKLETFVLNANETTEFATIHNFDGGSVMSLIWQDNQFSLIANKGQEGMFIEQVWKNNDGYGSNLITNEGYALDATWTGFELGIIWHKENEYGQNPVYLGRTDNDGYPIELEEIQLALIPTDANQYLADNWAIAWQDAGYAILGSNGYSSLDFYFVECDSWK